MTDSQRTLIAILLDRSGSMESIKSDTEGGFNAFIGDQRNEPGAAKVTLAQFDTEYDVVYANTAIDEVPPLQLQPRGRTALYDAIGRLITDVGADLAALSEDERPGHVIVVILTDGHENASREWTHEAVGAAIKRQETEYCWSFVFLGANMDALAVGRQMGFDPDLTMTYAPDQGGVASALRSTNSYVSRRRRSDVNAAPAGFSAADRDGALGTSR